MRPTPNNNEGKTRVLDQRVQNSVMSKSANLIHMFFLFFGVMIIGKVPSPSFCPFSFFFVTVNDVIGALLLRKRLIKRFFHLRKLEFLRTFYDSPHFPSRGISLRPSRCEIITVNFLEQRALNKLSKKKEPRNC